MRIKSSQIVVATLLVAVLAAVPPAIAGDASDSANGGPNVANSSGSSGQTLEIPPIAPTPSAGSNADSWTDGTNTYTWKDTTGEDSGAQAVPDQSLPQPSYAGIDAYMNQQVETETAMGPAFSPMFGAPMPFYPNPFMYGYGAPIYGYGYGYGAPVFLAPAPPAPPPPPRVQPPPFHPPGGGGFTHHFGLH